MDTAKIGKRGTLVIPAKLRQRFALKEGDLLVTEEREDGILLRPAVAVPVEIYTPQRKAEFFLNNAVSQRDYDNACRRFAQWAWLHQLISPTPKMSAARIYPPTRSLCRMMPESTPTSQAAVERRERRA